MVKNIRAFTLIELSIVVVIIGLIVAGIVAGQSLVHQAKMRTNMQITEQYIVAFNGFRLQYNAVPGDIANAESYWTSCVVEPSVPANTCNGDGNKIIRYQEHEDHRSLQHLMLAGLAQGAYTGQSGTWVAGLNMIALSDDKMAKYGNSDSTFYTKSAQHMGWFTSSSTSGVYNAADAYSIDIKYDDGVPHKGRIVNAIQGTSTPGVDCVSHANTATPSDNVTYILTSTSVSCIVRVYF